MALVTCPECHSSLSEKAFSCPHCGNPIKFAVRGFEWKSKAEMLGWPLVHIAFGRNKKTGRLYVAKGIIAIGQFAIGVITIAQFGIGILFGLGQFIAGTAAIGQFALGKYVLAQAGYGEYLWTSKIKNPEAVMYFRNLWSGIL